MKSHAKFYRAVIRGVRYCTSFALVIFVSHNTVHAQRINNFEKTCEEIGFKRKTVAFGECVLELDRREKNAGSVSKQRANAPLLTDITSGQNLTHEQAEDDRVCQSYGFAVNTPQIAECRFKIKLLREENIRRQEAYEQQMAEYQARLDAIQKDREREKALRQLEFGVRLLGGQQPVDAARSIGNMGLPALPTRPQSTLQTIILPGGRAVTCSMNGNIVNCF
jgi:hypothetical protein